VINREEKEGKVEGGTGGKERGWEKWGLLFLAYLQLLHKMNYSYVHCFNYREWRIHESGWGCRVIKTSIS